MRGKPHNTQFIYIKLRITPADAGKTSIVARSFTAYQDHPRGCGENLHPRVCGQSNAGSPPRMRGKLIPYTIPISKYRITPADAGKTYKTQQNR